MFRLKFNREQWWVHVSIDFGWFNSPVRLWKIKFCVKVAFESFSLTSRFRLCFTFRSLRAKLWEGKKWGRWRLNGEESASQGDKIRIYWKSHLFLNFLCYLCSQLLVTSENNLSQDWCFFANKWNEQMFTLDTFARVFVNVPSPRSLCW